MHPEIEKFWKEAGYTLIEMTLTSNWWGEKYDQGILIRRTLLADYYPDGYVYRWEYKCYTAEQMLRLIKLKAFL